MTDASFVPLPGSERGSLAAAIEAQATLKAPPPPPE